MNGVDDLSSWIKKLLLWVDLIQVYYFFRLANGKPKIRL